MGWKQKLLTAVMAGGLALRWLAGSDALANSAALQAGLRAVDRLVGWTLAVALVLAMWTLAGMLRRAVWPREPLEK